MTAKARSVPEDPWTTGFEDLTFLAVPMPVYKRLSDEAAKRGMSLAQFLRAAVDDYLGKTGSPRLLVEDEPRRP